MIGKPINYDKKYNQNTSIWGMSKLDPDLRKYLQLLSGKKVLDLGIGEGNNSVILSSLGYDVTGIDCSQKALDICKNKAPTINLIQSDIRNYKILPNTYDLIMSRCVLPYLHKQDIHKIITEIKNNLKQNGIIYIVLFSPEDDGFNKKYNSKYFDNLDNNIFHNKLDDSYFSFFTRTEILELFSDFQTIFISDEYNLDLFHSAPHYHGIIKYIGKKVN